jgi:hypothetical protein
MVCRVLLRDFDWSLVLPEALRPGEVPVRKVSAEMAPPIKVRKDNRDLRGSAEFTFSLDGVAWSKLYGQPAQRLPESGPQGIDLRLRHVDQLATRWRGPTAFLLGLSRPRPEPARHLRTYRANRSAVHT